MGTEDVADLAPCVYIDPRVTIRSTFESNQLGCEFWEPRRVALSPAELDQKILAFNPSAFPHGHPEVLPQSTFRWV
jgi:hypothetical protein